MSDSDVDLQKELSALEYLCKQWNCEVNLENSEIRVFRNGLLKVLKEIYFYGNENMNIASSYKYLGLIFSSHLVWCKACETLAVQSKKTRFPRYNLIRKYPNLLLYVIVAMFYIKIALLACYDSEIWGYTVWESVETKRDFFQKIHFT